MVERINSELASTLGNLVNRTISMSNKYFDGIVTNTNVNEDIDEDLKRVVTGTYSSVLAKMDKLRVSDAITLILICLNAVISILMKLCLGFSKDEEKMIWLIYII